MQNIVANDGSEAADRALLRAADIAQNGTLVGVVKPVDVTSLGPERSGPS